MNEQENNTTIVSSPLNLTDESYFTFQLGSGNFALAVPFVKEVLKYEPISAVPKALPYLKGVLNIRGSVVTIIDFRELFGFSTERSINKCSIIVLELKEENETQPLALGMIADSVDIVTRLELVNSENYDFASLPGRKDFIQGVAKKDDTFILILDLKKIIKSIEDEIERG